MADRYWVGGSGTWNTTSTTNWSATPGGSPGASRPTTADSVFFDRTGTYTVTMTGALGCLDITVTNGTVTFQNGTTPTLTINGSLSFNAGTVWDTTGLITFNSTAARSITSSGTTFNSPITFNGTGSFTLQSALTISSLRTTTLTAGTLSLNNFTLTTGLFASAGAAVKSIAFGSTGKILTTSSTTSTVWGTATSSNFSTSGSQLVECTGGGGAVTKTISVSILSEANLLNFSLIDVDSSVNYTFVSTNAIRNLTLNGSQNLLNVALSIFGDYTYRTTNGTTTFTGGGNAWTFARTSGTSIIDAPGAGHNFPVIFGTASSASSTFRLANDFNVGTRGDFLASANMRTAFFVHGTLDLNNFALITDVFESTNRGVGRILAFGTSGRIELNSTLSTATAVTVWNTNNPNGFNYTGNSEVRITASGMRANWQPTINTGGLTASQALNWNLMNYACAPLFQTNASGTLNIVRNLTLNTSDLGGSFGLRNYPLTILGDYTHISGSVQSGLNAWTFGATSGTSIIDASVGHDFPIIFGVVGSTATYRLARDFNVGTRGDFLAAGNVRTATFVAGTLDLNNFALYTDIFSSVNNNTRTIAFGTSGRIELNSVLSTAASVTIWNTSTLGGFSYTGTSNVTVTSNGQRATWTGIINTGSMSESQVLNWNISTFYTITTFTASNTVRNLTVSSNSIGSTLTNIALNIFGNYSYTSGILGAGTNAWTFVSSSTQTITGAGATHDFPITFNLTGTATLQSNFTVGPTRTVTLTAGTLNLNNFALSTGLFASTNTNTRTIAFGTSGLIQLTASTAVTYWNTSTTTNFAFTGTSNIETVGGGAVLKTINTGALAENQALSFALKDTAGTVTFTAGNVVRNFTINSAGGGAGALVNTTLNIYGDFTYISGTVNAGTNAWTFASSSTQNITYTTSTTLDVPWIFNGTGSWVLQSAVGITATRTTTLTNGTLNLNGFTYNTGLFTNAGGTHTLLANGGTLSLNGSGATVFNLASPGSITFSAGTSIGSISMTSSSAKTFVGSNLTYTGFKLNQGGTGTLTVTGSNTFADISASISSSAASTISFTAGTTTTFNTFTITGTSSFKPTLSSTTAGTRATFVSTLGSNGYITGADYILCRDIAFTPNAVDGSDYLRWYVGSNSTSLNNNVGAMFQTYIFGSTQKVYVIESGSNWLVPGDFNGSNNNVHLFGSGGGSGAGAAGSTFGTGGGGGGGGYTRLVNLRLTGGSSISYSIGTGGTAGVAPGGSGGNGGTTTFSTFSANGGQGGSGTTIPRATGGAGGTGDTFNGGVGGNGFYGFITGSPSAGGGGGGGAGGPQGVGAKGGNGVGFNGNGPGGGGGGGGGGSAGADAIGGQVGSNGGNNYAGVGGGTTSGTTGAATQTASFSGGGGVGGYWTDNPPGLGSTGIEILNTLGAAGGGGGGGGRQGTVSGVTGAPGGRYGGGAGGAGGGTSISNNGIAGSDGVIIISYFPVTGRFFSMF